MKTFTSIISFSVRLLLPFVAGILFALFFIRDIYKWNLDYTISVPHVLNLLTTLTVAFFVQHFLKRQSDNNEGKRELLAAQLTLVGTALEGVRECHSKGKNGKPPVGGANHVRKISNSIAALENCANSLAMNSMAASIKELKVKCMEYRIVMTSTDMPFEALHAENSWQALQQEVHKCLARLYSS